MCPNVLNFIFKYPVGGTIAERQNAIKNSSIHRGEIFGFAKRHLLQVYTYRRGRGDVKSRAARKTVLAFV